MYFRDSDPACGRAHLKSYAYNLTKMDGLYAYVLLWVVARRYLEPISGPNSIFCLAKEFVLPNLPKPTGKQSGTGVDKCRYGQCHAVLGTFDSMELGTRLMADGFVETKF